ncbi:hypothetical protein D3C81_1957730 [compost metagenome]
MQLLGTDQLRGQNALQLLNFYILQRAQLIVIVLHPLADREDFLVKIGAEPLHILGVYVFGHRQQNIDIIVAEFLHVGVHYFQIVGVLQQTLILLLLGLHYSLFHYTARQHHEHTD